MNMKTTRAMRDLLSILLATCKAKNLEDHISIVVDRFDNYPHNQYIRIHFIKELEEK